MSKRTAYAAGMRGRQEGARKRKAFTRATGIPAARYYGSIVARQPAGEMKYFDCDYNATTVSATTTTWVAGTLADPLTTINLGDAAVATPGCLFAPKVSSALNGRVGRQCKVVSIKIRGTFLTTVQAAQAAADAGMAVRIVLVLDQQTNAAAMTSAQLFNDGTAVGTTIHSMQNPNNFGRFRVLKEKKFTIGDYQMAGSPTAGDLVQGPKAINFKFNHKFAVPLAVHFNATNGGTVADIIDNSFHLIAAVGGTSVTSGMSYYSRVSYKE